MLDEIGRMLLEPFRHTYQKLEANWKRSYHISNECFFYLYLYSLYIYTYFS